MAKRKTPTSWQPFHMERSENKRADVETVGRIPIAFWLVLAFIAVCLISAFTSCTKKVYVPVETVNEKVVFKTDTLRQISFRYDSIYVRDSIALIHRNDTVFLTKFKDQVKYLYRTDTLYKTKTDSVNVYIEKPIPYEVEKIVYIEKPLKWWQKTLMWIGVACLACMILVVVIMIRKCT